MKYIFFALLIALQACQVEKCTDVEVINTDSGMVTAKLNAFKTSYFASNDIKSLNSKRTDCTIDLRDSLPLDSIILIDFNKVKDMYGKLPQNCIDAYNAIVEHGKKNQEELSFDSIPSSADNSLSLGRVAIKGAIGSINKRGVVKINGCTGSMISPYIIVTAAHCLDNYDADGDNIGVYSGIIEYFDPALLTTTTRNVKPTPQVSFSIHPAYAGGPDTESDIAIISSWNPWINTTRNDYLKMSKGSLSAVPIALFFGQGYDSYAGNGAGTLRYESIRIEWYGTNHFYGLAYNHRICKGDSGGPWIWDSGDEDIIVGVMSNIEVANSGTKNCATEGGKERATRLSTKSDWIVSLNNYINPNAHCGLITHNGQLAYECY